MKQVYQTKFGAPEGNCFNACVASIIGCGLEALPDLEEIEAQGIYWLDGLNECLRPRGYAVIHIPASAEEPADVYIPIGAHFIASGDGYGGLHSVVFEQRGHGGENIWCVHDPYREAQTPGLKTVRSFQFVVKI